MTNPCCKDCPARYPACHDHCPQFTAWRIEKSIAKLQRCFPGSYDYVQVFKADDDLGNELTATVSEKEVTVTVENGVDYIVYYYKKSAKPQVVHLDSKHFPKAYRVEGSIPYKTEDDVIIEAHPIWYKAVPQAGFELSWQNTGDPVSLTMTFDVLADADGNMFDLVFDGE